MTRFDPSLFIRHIKVQKGSKVVLNLPFHGGFNVIYGENSSGKSTILDFIFYAIGGDTPQWQPEAAKCDQVICSVLLNGEPVVMKRDIAKKATERPPIAIYWGTLEQSESAGPSKWELYSYSRSKDKDSYSQVMFRALGIPEIPLDDGSNLTFHQLLRLVYSDQMTPPDVIFREEGFDRQITKEAVGEIVCGIFLPESYKNEILIRKLTSDLDEVSEELSNIFSVLGHLKEDVNAISIHGQISNVTTELKDCYDRISALEAGDFTKNIKDNRDSVARSLGKVIKNGASRRGELDSSREFLRLDIDDLKRFLVALKANYEAIIQSDAAVQELGELSFLYCPACLSPVSAPISEDMCCLCKSPVDGEQGSGHRLRLRRELEMQISESEILLRKREANLTNVERELSDLDNEIKKARREYRAVTESIDDKVRYELKRLYERRGYLERSLEELNNKLRLGEKVSSVSQRKAEIQKQLSLAQDMKASFHSKILERRAVAATLISETTRNLLNNDLLRQDTFRSARSVGFSFGKDYVSVDGESRFSASSTVYLKNAFMYSLLEASMRDGNFLFPRIIFLDGIEDKGMEVERVHHLQRILYKRSQDVGVEHQLIITAEKLAPELVRDDLIVGRRFTHSNRSLDL